MRINAPIFLGNWKMNFLKADCKAFFETFLSIYKKSPATVGFTPPFTILDYAANLIKNRPDILLGSQNLHWLEFGPHTGEISGPMLSELGVSFSIIGHSERRSQYGEKSELVALRTKAALTHKIKPIVCVGENESDFKAGKSEDVVLDQLKTSLEGVAIKSNNDLIVAYEPVWAIGTGLSAKPDQANNICKVISSFLKNKYNLDLPILYGGSVDEKNVTDLIREEYIDGFLVGGASLKPEVFCSMILKAE